MAILEHRLLQLMPLGRMIDAEDVAKTVLYLASDASSYMTGTEIVVDGGLSTAPYGAPATVGSWMSLVL
jgi:NAD(P)-dependent dehydrogenase (short-subunit alcohol dehydrogenase family)